MNFLARSPDRFTVWDASALPRFRDKSAMAENSKEKPTQDEVLAYAQEQVSRYIKRMARDASPAHHEEMAQNALFRIWRLYPRMDASRGLKAYVQKHCRGAVLDYRRAGSGFMETRQKKSTVKNPSPAFTSRASINDMTESEAEELDRKVFAIHGVSIDFGRIWDDVNWELLSRMARKDIGLHVFVRHVLLEETIEDLAPIFGVTRECLSQYFQAFIRSLKSKDRRRQADAWINQVIFALGLSDRLGRPAEDFKVGWSYQPVDFRSSEPFNAGDRRAQTKHPEIAACAAVPAPSIEERAAEAGLKANIPKSDTLAMDGDEHLQMNFFGGESA